MNTTKLVHDMRTSYKYISGYTFDFEYPGFFAYTKDDISVYFTPDHSNKGEVCIQVFRDGVCLHTEDISYTDMSAEILVGMVKPILERFW